VITTNQGLILPDGTDNANVPLTFTDFVTTAGSGMENRLVQRYLSPADRLARNAAPNEGELSYLASTDGYEFYNGTAWIPLSKGFVSDATRVSSTAGFTTTEIVTDPISFTSNGPAVMYKLSFFGFVQSTVANDLAQIRFRWQTGGTLTTAGTQFSTVTINCDVAGRGALVSFYKVVTGIPAGTASIGVTMVRNSGTGTLTSVGNANQENYVLLEID
jgi:hypothetical protein